GFQMRKLFLLTAAVAALAVPGTLVAAAPTLSLQASPTIVTFGGAVTLSGTLSSAKTGQSITVEGQDCGKTAFAKVATVMTTTNGAWTASAKPALNTTYRAKNKGTTSGSVLVKVRPQLKLTRVAAGKFTAKVGAAQSFVGKYVAFQRWSATKRKYATVKK